MSEPLLSPEANELARAQTDRWGKPVSVAHVLPNVLLLVIANGFVTPGLPAVVSDFFGGDKAAASELQGAADSVGAALGFFSTALLGAASDRIGRRPFFVAAAFAQALPFIALALLPAHMYLFFGLRAAQGVLSGGSRYGNTALLCAFIADVHPTDAAARTKDFGVVFAASMVGSALSPLINLLPTDGKDHVGANDRIIFACAACAAGLNVLYCLYLLPETRQGTMGTAGGRTGRQSKHSGSNTAVAIEAGAGGTHTVGDVNQAQEADAGHPPHQHARARGVLAMLWSPFDAVLFLFRPTRVVAADGQRTTPTARGAGSDANAGADSPHGGGGGGAVGPQVDVRRRVLVCLAVVSFFGSLPESGILDVSLYYLKDKLGFDRSLNGWLFFGFGVVGLVAQTIVLRMAMRLLRRRRYEGNGKGGEAGAEDSGDGSGVGNADGDGDAGEDNGHAEVGGLKWLLVLALIAESAHFAVYALSSRVWMPFLAIGLAAIYLLSTPAMNGIVSATLSSDEQGAGLGALGSLKSLCGVFGPFLFTGLYGQGKHMSPPLPELPFIVSSVLVFVAVAAAVAIPSRDTK